MVVGLLLLAALGAVWLVVRVADVIKVLAIALLFTLAIAPVVDRLERWRIPRAIGLTVLLVVVGGVVILVGIILIPPLATQVSEFLSNLPAYWGQLQGQAARLLRSFPSLQHRLEALDVEGIVSSRASSLLAAAGNVAMWVADFLASVALIALATVFMLLNPRPLLGGILSLVPDRHQEKARFIADQAAFKLRAWVQGILILSAVVGAVTGVGLSVIGVPYALLFGMLAALLEVVPTLGPVLSAVPPTLVALTISPLTAVYVIVLFVLVQQAESNLLAPVVMSKQLEVHPLSALVALLTMASLLGVFGAVVALPVLAVLKVLYDHLYLPAVHPRASLEPPAQPVILPPPEAGPPAPPAEGQEA